MRWAGHVSHVGVNRCAYRVLVGKPERKRRLEDQHRDGKVILKLIFKKWIRAWTGLICLKIRRGGKIL
jgi:hypothetical protein